MKTTPRFFTFTGECRCCQPETLKVLLPFWLEELQQVRARHQAAPLMEIPKDVRPELRLIRIEGLLYSENGKPQNYAPLYLLVAYSFPPSQETQWARFDIQENLALWALVSEILRDAQQHLKEGILKIEYPEADGQH